MPAKRLSMRKIREVLRLRLGLNRSIREVAQSISASSSTVWECLARAEAAGLGWPLDDDLDDTRLENLLYPVLSLPNQARAAPDLKYLHQEMRRKGVTLMLLWQEYKRDHPENGYQYSQFCELYRTYVGKLDVVLRQDHRAGEKVFIDYSGDGIPIVDPATGDVSEAALFVAVLGASSYTYAEATSSQKLPCWIESHIHAYEYYGGVPELTVPDNPKTAVTRACRYDPDVNVTYLEMAKYYNTAVLPARPRKPRDKAKVEAGVLLAQRWILAALRNHKFFSIEQANEAIIEKLDELNNRKFQKLETTRRELFESLDRPALRPLPATRYEVAEWSRPKVNIDYHVEVERHYYSVPYQLIHNHVEVRLATRTVEVFFKGQRVTSHERSYVQGTHTTKNEHMPLSHQKYVEWTPERLFRWAGEIGPATGQLCERIVASRAHPQQGFRACLGILRHSKKYGNKRVDAACRRALAIGTLSYRSVSSILKAGLDKQPLTETDSDDPLPGPHGNIRGEDYYH